MNAKPTQPALSPLAPKSFPRMPAVAGADLAAGACGLAKSGRSDVVLVELAPETTAAGVFTRSLTASAPVRWCREAIRGGQARGLIVNSAGANAFTGPQGMEAVERTVEAVADHFSCRPSKILAASTGVIGEPLAYEKIINALPGLKDDLSPLAWEAAAKAIMTTDTYPKGATRTANIGGIDVTINGFAKGSGMIHPDMATMLAFVFTDATLPAGVLQALLTDGAAKSFNCITVDSDTSTSDTVLLFATGAGGQHHPIEDPGDAGLGDFKEKLLNVMTDLAHQVVRDGEGASKFITVTVGGAETDEAAKRIAFAIANSPLVKTAIAGEDANWGRVVMAVGKAGEKVDAERLAIEIGGVPVAKGGGAVAGYDEKPVVKHMKGQEITIAVDAGVGEGAATVWTCDLTHGYIDINADYRT